MKIHTAGPSRHPRLPWPSVGLLVGVFVVCQVGDHLDNTPSDAEEQSESGGFDGSIRRVHVEHPGVGDGEETVCPSLESTRGLVFSQAFVLALVEAGNSRDEAYGIVQRNPLRSRRKEAICGGALLAEPAAALDRADLDACFDPARFLAPAAVVFEPLKACVLPLAPEHQADSGLPPRDRPDAPPTGRLSALVGQMALVAFTSILHYRNDRGE